MATGLVELRAGVTLGAERKAITVSQQILSLSVSHDRIVNLPNGAPGTTVTLFDASSDTPTTFSILVVQLDPDGVEATALSADVEVTAAGAVTVYRMTRGCPLVIPGSVAYPSLGGSAGAVTKVRARQIAATSDMNARILILG